VETAERTIRTNYTGTVNLTELLEKILNDDGKIIMLGSKCG